VNSMKSLLAVCSAAICLFATTYSAEAKPKKENMLYTASYEYDFGEAKNVSTCIAKATVALTKHGLSNGLTARTEEDGRFGYVYGWSPDRTSTAEIDCNMDEKESNIAFSHYTDDPEATWETWNRLSDAKW